MFAPTAWPAKYATNAGPLAGSLNIAVKSFPTSLMAPCAASTNFSRSPKFPNASIPPIAAAPATIWIGFKLSPPQLTAFDSEKLGCIGRIIVSNGVLLSNSLSFALFLLLNLRDSLPPATYLYAVILIKSYPRSGIVSGYLNNLFWLLGIDLASYTALPCPVTGEVPSTVMVMSGSTSDEFALDLYNSVFAKVS